MATGLGHDDEHFGRTRVRSTTGEGHVARLERDALRRVVFDIASAPPGPRFVVRRDAELRQKLGHDSVNSTVVEEMFSN